MPNEIDFHCSIHYDAVLEAAESPNLSTPCFNDLEMRYLVFLQTPLYPLTREVDGLSGGATL